MREILKLKHVNSFPLPLHEHVEEVFNYILNKNIEGLPNTYKKQIWLFEERAIIEAEPSSSAIIRDSIDSAIATINMFIKGAPANITVDDIVNLMNGANNDRKKYLKSLKRLLGRSYWLPDVVDSNKLLYINEETVDNKVVSIIKTEQPVITEVRPEKRRGRKPNLVKEQNLKLIEELKKIMPKRNTKEFFDWLDQVYNLMNEISALTWDQFIVKVTPDIEAIEMQQHLMEIVDAIIAYGIVNEKYDAIPLQIAKALKEKPDKKLTIKQREVLDKKYAHILAVSDKTQNVDKTKCVNIARELKSKYLDKLDSITLGVVDFTIKFNSCSEKQQEVLENAFAQLTSGINMVERRNELTKTKTIDSLPDILPDTAVQYNKLLQGLENTTMSNMIASAYTAPIKPVQTPIVSVQKITKAATVKTVQTEVAAAKSEDDDVKIIPVNRPKEAEEDDSDNMLKMSDDLANKLQELEPDWPDEIKAMMANIG